MHANFFQYLPFLDDFNRRTGNRSVPVVPVHIEPFGLYSASIPDIDAIPEFAEVALPSDPVNVHRSLMMLDQLGLIDCAPQALATVTDVRSNPRRLVFKELTSWLLGGVRDNFDVVFLFGNQAMEWGVDTGSALSCDRGNSEYAEYLVARPDNCDSFAIRALADALNCGSTFITTTYAGQVLAAFSIALTSTQTLSGSPRAGDSGRVYQAGTRYPKATRRHRPGGAGSRRSRRACGIAKAHRPTRR